MTIDLFGLNLSCNVWSWIPIMNFRPNWFLWRQYTGHNSAADFFFTEYSVSIALSMWEILIFGCSSCSITAAITRLGTSMVSKINLFSPNRASLGRSAVVSSRCIKFDHTSQSIATSLMIGKKTAVMFTLRVRAWIASSISDVLGWNKGEPVSLKTPFPKVVRGPQDLVANRSNWC